MPRKAAKATTPRKRLRKPVLSQEEEAGFFRFVLGGFFRKFDFAQIIPLFLLLGIGELFIYGTGQQVGGVHAEVFWQRQLAYMGIGLMIWLVMIFLDYRWLGPLSVILYPAAIALLVYVLMVGVERFNARRWLELGGLSLQPSELAKLAVILIVSWLLSFGRSNVNSIFWLFPAVLLTAIPFVLIYKEPDLGSALVLFPILSAIVFVSNLKWRYILILLIVIVAAAPVAYFSMRPYQKERIITFLDPDRDPQNRGWNAIQAEIAVGSGGTTGKGYRNGTHCMLGYLPKTVANSDFIFPVIAEETGFIGAFSLILLYVLLFYSVLRTALLAPDQFGRNLCAGIGALLLMHTVVNIGMCIRLMPITGLPLPLVSYGGTFMIAMMTYMGIVQSVYAHREKDSFLALE